MKSILLVLALAVVFQSIGQNSSTQTEIQKLSTTILHLDSLFWKAYNNCEVEKMKQFFTDDIEFYHDKGGVTKGATNLADALKKNLCGNDSFRTRREAIRSSVKIFPLHQNNNLYGAVISGDHLFFLTIKGKKESLDGQAKFFEVWLLKDGAWQMSRVISYDHNPPRYVSRKKPITLSPDSLDQFTGTYKGPITGIMKVKRENNLLTLSFKDQKLLLFPETRNRFFIRESDLTFEFIKNIATEKYKLRVREKGKVVEEAKYSNTKD